MDIVLIVLGAACLIGAVVGGGVKVKQKDTEVAVPVVASHKRQVLLAILGLAFIAGGWHLYNENQQRVEDMLRPIFPGIGAASQGARRSSDALAGVWMHPGDGSSMHFQKSDDGYDVISSKPGGFTDKGTATLDKDEVSVWLSNPMVGDYGYSLSLSGDHMSGTGHVNGQVFPVALSRIQ